MHASGRAVIEHDDRIGSENEGSRFGDTALRQMQDHSSPRRRKSDLRQSTT